MEIRMRRPFTAHSLTRRDSNQLFLPERACRPRAMRFPATPVFCACSMGPRFRTKTFSATSGKITDCVELDLGGGQQVQLSPNWLLWHWISKPVRGLSPKKYRGSKL